MTVTTDKIADAAAARADAARHLALSKVAQVRANVASKASRAQAKRAALSMPPGWPAGHRIERASDAARTASKEAARQFKQARAVMQERVIPTVVPMASSAMDQASHRFDEFMVSSAPVRKEAMRRGLLAAAVLRGADAVVVKKRRRWPVAVLFMAVGGAAGAAAAWLSQAGKPVQLTPYPIPAEEGDHTVDLTSEDAAHHES